MTMALISLVVALAACGWTTAYAWTDIIPSLLWLEQVSREDAWLDSIAEMQRSLDILRWLETDLFPSYPRWVSQYVELESP